MGKCEDNNATTLVKEVYKLACWWNYKTKIDLISVPQIHEVSFLTKGLPVEIMLLSLIPLVVNLHLVCSPDRRIFRYINEGFETSFTRI